MEIGNLVVDRSGPDTMARTHLPYWMAVVVVLFASAACLADGKTFAMVADPLSDRARTTMPSQRAIIAWDGAEQRLAIDTAFTGEGTEFAWLVPLPSEPEILPATKGMFDTAAVLTAPRIERSDHGVAFLLGGSLVIGAFGVMALQSRMGRVWFLLAIVVVGILVVMPNLGYSRGRVGLAVPVEVLSSGTAGLYDTRVLRAQDADELIAWLESAGFGVPDGIAEVVQDYLDEGWVFAAAKLSVDGPQASEHRAHPLQFRFATDSPIYPMALTAVGNEDIELELFVFADGSAHARGLRVACSFQATAIPAAGDDPDLGQGPRARPVAIAHPGLLDITESTGELTRLIGTLTPRQQRRDIQIGISAFAKRDAALYEAGSGIERGVAAGLIVAGAVGVVLALVFVHPVHSQERVVTRQWCTIGVMLVAGAVVGSGALLATPMYRGAVSSGGQTYARAMALEYIAHDLVYQSEQQPRFGRQEVAVVIEHYAASDTGTPVLEGDSPLHYRLEDGDSDASIWFVWHDAIGAEHRTEITLTTEAGDDSD